SSEHMLHAFLFSDGATTDLGTLDGNGQSEAKAVNPSGQIVGVSGFRAFLYAGGVMTDLGTIADYNSFSADEHSYEAVGINAAGQVVGNFSYTTSVEPGFPITVNGFGGAWLYSDGTMRDLNTLIDSS